jgi:hypothetical protein
MVLPNTLAYYNTATITAVKSCIVEASGWKRMTLPNTLAYYDMATITVVKSYIVEASGGSLTVPLTSCLTVLESAV